LDYLFKGEHAGESLGGQTKSGLRVRLILLRMEER